MPCLQPTDTLLNNVSFNNRHHKCPLLNTEIARVPMETDADM